MNASWSNQSNESVETFLDCDINRRDLTAFVVTFAIIIHAMFFGNALIVWCVWKFPHMRSTVNYLLANLAMSNNMLCLHIILELVQLYVHLNEEERNYVCLFKFACVMISFIGSECNMLLLSVQRFIAVVYPLKHKTMILHTKLRYILVLCWIMYYVVAFLPLLSWNTIHEENCNIKAIFATSYFAICCGFIILGLTVNIFLFAKVLYTIQCTRIAKQPVRQNRKTMWISFCILLGFIVCWGPIMFALFMRTISTQLPAVFPCPKIIVIIIGTVNGLVNLIVYGLCNSKFRQAFKAILTGKSLKRESQYTTSR